MDKISIPANISIPAIALITLGFMSACGSGGDSDSTLADSESLIDGEPIDTIDSPGGDEGVDTNELENTGSLLPTLFATQTDLDLEYAQSGVDIIERLSDSFILPEDIDVFFIDCGIANAFYIPPSISFANPETPEDNDTQDLPPTESEVTQQTRSAGGSIVMCHELTQLFANFYNDKDQAVSTSIFVLMHELGHALVNQLSLPVLGIEESYVDGFAAVFLGEAGLSEGSVLAGWFFGSQPETPFFDSHRAGPQRLGDLACWGVGSDPALLDDPIISSIALQLMTGGRNCPAEYGQQLSGLTAVLEPHTPNGFQSLFTEGELF